MERDLAVQCRDLAVQCLYIFSAGVSSLRYLGTATLQKGSASISSPFQFTDTAGLLHVYQIKTLKQQERFQLV